MGIWQVNQCLLLFVGILIELLIFGGVDGVVFLIICNFYVILCYNNVDSYVLVVVYLVDWLKGYLGFVNLWFVSYFGLCIEQCKEMQQFLIMCGFDMQGVDGNVGLNIMNVICVYQQLCGLLVIGQLDVVLLQQLCWG